MNTGPAIEGYLRRAMSCLLHILAASMGAASPSEPPSQTLVIHADGVRDAR